MKEFDSEEVYFLSGSWGIGFYKVGKSRGGENSACRVNAAMMPLKRPRICQTSALSEVTTSVC